MDIAVEIAVGSTLQVAMFVAPLLVLLSLIISNSDATCLYAARADYDGNSSIFNCHHFQ